MAAVLLVEDDADSCEVIATFLRRAGHDVTAVTNGREALAQVLAKVPDVVLLDVMMPELDGPAFLGIVRSYLRLQSLPAVVLTGLPGSVETLRSLNVSSILVKGKASLEDIRRAVEDALAHLPA